MNWRIFTNLRDYAKDVTLHFESVAFYVTSLVVRITQSKNRNLLRKLQCSCRKKQLVVTADNSVDWDRTF